MKQPWAILALFLLLPFALFFWLVPFVSPWSLGNDYQDFMLPFQMELQFSWQTGEWPLFVPGYGGGQSAATLTLAQFFHPISHVASWMPGYWDGYALQWNTLLRLLTLGGTHFALFQLLRRLVRTDLAFAFSLVAVYNLRALDLFRYGSALEAHTGLLLLFVSLAWLSMAPQRRGPHLAVMASTAWLLTSGYPPMLYYGFLGALGLGTIWPWLLGAIAPDRALDAQRRRRYWLHAATCIGVGLAVSAAYWVPYYFDFVATNSGRVGQDYAWAARFTDTLAGTFDNFFRPLRSDVSSAFGATPLFVVAALVPGLALLRVRIPAVIWVVWGFVVLLFLHIQGPRTPVHWLAWSTLPMASALRIAGRVSMVLPLALVLLLTWAAGATPAVTAGEHRLRKLPPLVILAGAALAATLLYIIVTAIVQPLSTSLAPISTGVGSRILQNRTIGEWVEPVTTVLGVLTLFALGACKVESRHARALGVCVGLFVCLQVTGLLFYGTWRRPPAPSPTLAQLRDTRSKTLDLTWRTGGFYSAVVMDQLNGACLEPMLAKLHPKTEIVASADAAFATMRRHRDPDTLLVVDATAAATPLVPTASWDGRAEVRMAFSSYNRQSYDTECDTPAVLGTALPFSGYWSVTVDGAPAPVLQVAGLHSGVAVPAGTHRVEWRFWSWSAAIGVWLSIVALAGIGLWCATAIPTGPRRIGAMVATGIVAAAAIAGWHATVYGGDNLNTDYRWTRPPPGPVNLAYGKLATLTSPGDKTEPHIQHPSRAVDGDRRTHTAAISAVEPAPAFTVDLAAPKVIGALVIYEPSGPQFNARPLIVEASATADGGWREVARITASAAAQPQRVTPAAPITAQFIRVRSQGTCRLAICELEIFPPAGR